MGQGRATLFMKCRHKQIDTPESARQALCFPAVPKSPSTGMRRVLAPPLALMMAVALVLGWPAATWGEERVAADWRARALRVLQHEFAGNDSWVRVHAAEALIEHGQIAGIGDVYRAELREAPPPYRIGVRRVLARIASTAEERETHVDAIRAALRDVNGPDRVHAAETLAKLGMAQRGDLAVVESWSAQADAPTSAYLQWLRVELSADAERPVAEVALATVLRASDPTARLRAAYALARLAPLSAATVRVINDAWRAEPDGSPARAYLLAAAWVHLPKEATERHDVNAKLRAYLAGGTPSEMLEVAVVLGRYGDRAAAPALAALLDAAHPDARIGGASGLLYLLK